MKFDEVADILLATKPKKCEPKKKSKEKSALVNLKQFESEVNQLQTTPTINFVNTVVIGKFNPAILTSGFLSTKCHMDFGNPLREQRAPQNLFSEIAYQSITWFMDLQRFQVQEVGLGGLEDFNSPEYVSRYLELLPYTPINMAGINAAISFTYPNSLDFWGKLSDLNFIMNVVSAYGATSCEVTYGNIVSIDKTPELRSVLIAFKTHEEAKIRMNIGLAQNEQIVADYNWEIGDVGNKPDRLSFLVDNRRDIIGILPRLLEAFMEGNK